MSETETTKQAPATVSTNEPVDAGVALTEKQKANGTHLYFTPAQEGVDRGVTVKAKSFTEAVTKANELQGDK